MRMMESRRASFDKLRTRGNLRGTKKDLMLSVSKHARCRSPIRLGTSGIREMCDSDSHASPGRSTAWGPLAVKAALRLSVDPRERMLDYLKRLSGPALSGTLAFVGWDRANPDWFRIYFSAAAILTAGILGLVATALDRALLGAAMIASSVLAIPVLYLWRLFVAAFEAEQELRGELDGLKNRVQYNDARTAQRLRQLLD